MKSENIVRENNYVPPTHLYCNDNIVLKFWKLIKNMIRHVCLAIFFLVFNL